MSRIPDRVVIATRGSKLAMWQSRWIAGRLREIHSGLEVELLVVKTTGDRFQQASLQVLGGKGAFTKEITEAILSSKADLAVHSLKDLPTQAVPGLKVWAYPPRFNPLDAWIGRDGLHYHDLSEGAVVATGSLRRAAQVLHHHPGVRIEPIRGNVDTRLRRFAEGDMAGMFLAAAGLERLDLAHHVTELMADDDFLPAPGQGSLAVEGRADETTRALLAPLNDPDTETRVTAERAFLAELEGGCQVPVASLAVIEGNDVLLHGLVAALDGSHIVRDSGTGPRRDAEGVGRSLAAELLGRGAREILASIRSASEPYG